MVEGPWLKRVRRQTAEIFWQYLWPILTALVVCSATNTCTHYGGIEVALEPVHVLPAIDVYFVLEDDWFHHKCDIGTLASDCAVLLKSELHTVRAKPVNIFTVEGEQYLVRVCEGRIVGADLVNPTAGARNAYAVTCQ